MNNLGVSGGLSVGAEVKNLPLLVEVQTSLYDDAVQRGAFSGSFADFLSFLSGSGGLSDAALGERLDQAVAKALQSVGTMPGQLDAAQLAETIKSEVAAAAAKFAGGSSKMPGVYVLNDLLPSEIAEDLLRETPLYPERHTAEIQKAYDELAPNHCRVHLYGNVKAHKLTGYRIDLYGMDNQAVAGRTDLVRHGMQPCLLVHGVGVTLDLAGCVFEVQDMFQDGIHLTQGNFVCNASEIRTKRIHEIDPTYQAAQQWRGGITGSKGHGRDWLPMIDANTGMSVKGGVRSGFNTTANNSPGSGVPHFELSPFRSNALDTSRLNSGGYPAADGGKDFPQDDGSVADVWGKWGGGFIGNRCAGIVIFTLPNTPKHIQESTTVGVYKCRIRGFAYDGVDVGLLGGLDGAQHNDVDSRALPLVPHNVVLKDNVVYDVYESAFQLLRYVNVMEIGNRVYRSGHPDWSLDHKTRENQSYISINPGYGSSSSRYVPQVGRYIENCWFIDCARKGIDAHTGTDTYVNKVRIKSGLYGISIAVEEKHSNPREDSSNGHQLCIYRIRDVDIDCSCYGLHLINGALSEHHDGRAWDLRTDILVDGFVIKAPRPYFNNYGRGGMKLKNGVITFGAPYGLQSGVSQYAAIYLGSENPGNRGIPDTATLENIEIMNSSKGNFTVGLEILPLNKFFAQNITIHTTPFTVNADSNAAYAGEAGMLNSGVPTRPLSVRTKPVMAFGGGITAFDAVRNEHTLLDAQLDIGVPVSSGGGGNAASPAPPPVSVNRLLFGLASASGNSAVSDDGSATVAAVGIENAPSGYVMVGGDPAVASSPVAQPTGTSASVSRLLFGLVSASGNGAASDDGNATVSAVGIENAPSGYVMVGGDPAAASSPVAQPTGTSASVSRLLFGLVSASGNGAASDDGNATVSVAGIENAPAGYFMIGE